MGHVGLIVKATRLCNLRCDYCHDWATGPNQRMGFDVLARTIAAALRDREHGAVDFMWHGGEPTVLPIAFYEKALLIQARFRRPGQVVTNALQTNGTTLDATWARFLAANRFSVGVSLDGPRAVHDRHRRYASGRPSFEDALRGIRLLQEHGVRVGVLMVIDEGALELGPDAVFDFFVEHAIKNIGLIAAKPTNDPDARPGTPAAHYTEPARMNAFLARVYDRWLEYGDRSIRIRELEGIRGRLARRRDVLCTLAGGCMGHYYLVEPNGDVAHCDVFVGDPRYTLGNVRRQTFADFRTSPRMTALRKENERALAAMRSCPEFAICNGWCPHERYVSIRHNALHRSDCCGLRDLISHIRARMGSERGLQAAEGNGARTSAS